MRYWFYTWIFFFKEMHFILAERRGEEKIINTINFWLKIFANTSSSHYNSHENEFKALSHEKKIIEYSIMCEKCCAGYKSSKRVRAYPVVVWEWTPPLALARDRPSHCHPAISARPDDLGWAGCRRSRSLSWSWKKEVRGLGLSR